MSAGELIVLVSCSVLNALIILTFPRRIAAEIVKAQAWSQPEPAKVLRPVFRTVRGRGPEAS